VPDIGKNPDGEGTDATDGEGTEATTNGQHGGGGGSGVTRRQVLAGAGGAGLFVVGGAAGYAIRGPGSSNGSSSTTATATQASVTEEPSVSSKGTPDESESDQRSPTILPLRFFSAPEALVIGAMADRIYPSDSNGPGATEIGVVQYIDRQLAGAWGSGERMYRQGPFTTPTDTGHGWQYALTPGDAYRVALVSLGDYTTAKYGGQTYDALSSNDQEAVLNALMNDKVPTFTQISGPDFFAMFLENVKEGVFADPSYGGNLGVAGWKLVGYPGDPMAYGDDQFKYVTDYGYSPPGEPRPLIVAPTSA
jgi:gluconate 2-dehydrogenase gamma chain